MNHILKKALVIMGMIFFAWILVLFLAIDMLFESFYGWVGFCGGVLALVLSVLSLVLWRQNDARDATEVTATPLVITSAYFATAILVNTLFCFLASQEFPGAIPIAIDAVLTIAFVSVRMFMLPYQNRVSYTAAHTANKTQGTVKLSAKLGELIGMAQDAAVKQQLKALKEQLDYSNNVSQTLTGDLESLLFRQLCDISAAINQQEPAEVVLKKIDAAQCTWKRRNGALFTN